MIREAFQFASADFPVWLLRLVFSVTIVCLSAALANLLLRRFSAAMRHRVSGSGVAASLAMPAMILWSPEFRLGWLNVAKPRPVLPPDSPLVADLEPASPAIQFDPRVFESQGADSNVPPHRATTSGNTRFREPCPRKAICPTQSARRRIPRRREIASWQRSRRSRRLSLESTRTRSGFWCWSCRRLAAFGNRCGRPAQCVAWSTTRTLVQTRRRWSLSPTSAGGCSGTACSTCGNRAALQSRCAWVGSGPAFCCRRSGGAGAR